MSITINLPTLSPTMTEGIVAKWHVREGDEVAPGDILADIETDKATIEMEAVDAGRIGRILVPAGKTSVAVHTPLAILLEEGEVGEQTAATDSEAGSAAQKSEKTKGAMEASCTQETGCGRTASSTKPLLSPTSSLSPVAVIPEADRPPRKRERIFASPLARRLAQERGIDLNSMQGSGPYGRIIQRDVETFQPTAVAGAGSMNPRAFYARGSYEEIPLDNMRRSIAVRLSQSVQQAPHYHIGVDCRIGTLIKARKLLNERREIKNSGLRLSINDLIVRAVALALMEVPDVNSSWAGECLLRHRHADISIAVALEDGGLITPILREAENKGLVKIATESRDLITRARERRLVPEDFEGGSFTISNLGMFGIDAFTAVINPPQSAILAVGRTRKVPVVSDESGEITVADVMSLTLSCDHRVIDGAPGARFLKALQERVEDPLTLLL